MRRLLRAITAFLVILAPALGHAQGRGLSPRLAGEIEALLRDKDARTPIQRKIDSQLIYQARMSRGFDAAPGVRTLRTGIVEDADGLVAIDVKGEVSDGLLARIVELGGAVVHASPHRGTLRVRLPLAAVEELAALAEVRHVRPAGRAFTRKDDTSEGDVAHKADQARAIHGIDGTGVTVGVLSDGVDDLAAVQASGDLPGGVVVLAGQEGTGSEGTAMLEIIHDLAPGAALMFATAFISQASFADNIVALRAAGADIIVDDVGYFAEAAFQDDDVAAAVDTVVADGALYFSSAGNGGNLNDGTSGTWEGDFVAGGTLDGSPALDFGSGTNNKLVDGNPFVYALHWSDPLGGSGNDYDLFLTNKQGTVAFGSSTNVQDGDDDPFEIFGAAFNDVGRYLVVVKRSGADRALHLATFGGELADATDGEVAGHPGARGAIAVAATDWLFANGPGGTFDGTEEVELYSSDGPRRIHYEADGTPITPGDFSFTGGELREKPDLTGADCVSTTTPGFGTFCGTSAAAPHAAAMAALLWELAVADGATPDDLRAAVAGTALDIEAAGPDRDSGAGIADVLAAADALAASCSNGLDDDGDGATDLADPGCDDAGDASERSEALPCDDGGDDDGDGLVDMADPGCFAPDWATENPPCDNGLDDDGDGGIDWSGIDLNGDEDFDDPDEFPPDPHCVDRPWRGAETPPKSCGLGPGLAPLLAALWLRRRRTRERAGTGSYALPR